MNDVIEIPDKKTDTLKVLPANMDAFTAATIEEDAEEMEDAPKQKTIRRGGVSAEAVQEEDFGTFEKKVGIENTMQCLKTGRLLLVNKSIWSNMTYCWPIEFILFEGEGMKDDRKYNYERHIALINTI